MLTRAVVLLVAVSITCPSHAQVDEAMLRLPVQVQLPDGSAAVQARVCLMQHQRPRIVAETDAQGRAFFESNFELSPILAVESLDGRFSTAASVSQSEVRELCQSIFTVALKATNPLRVRVTRDGVPVADAEVAPGRGFRHVKTDDQGVATLQLPAPETDIYISVWHAEKGIGAAVLAPGSVIPDSLDVALETPVARKIRVLNQFAKPIPNLSLTAEVLLSTDSEEERRFFLADEYPLTAFTTDSDGRADFLWSNPRRRPNYELLDMPGWALDGEPHADDEPSPDPKILHVLHARARVPLSSEILLPKGREKRGVLIRAVSDGIGSSFDFCSARSDDDGKFQLMVAPGHAYAIAVEDSEWSSEVRTPFFIPNPPQFPEVLRPLELVPNVPLEVIVTSSKTGEPLRGQFVEVGRRVFIENGGTHERLLAGWWKTDATGRIRTRVAPGPCEIRVPGQGWQETRSVNVLPGAPQRTEILGP